VNARAQASYPPSNDLPNPYQTISNWAQLPDGRKWGATSGVAIGPDGNIWTYERCGGNGCADSSVPPILEFDLSGKMLKTFGAGLFVLPLQSEFGLSRADASSSVIILFIGTFFLSPMAGRILDRAPIRLAVGAGTICFSLALAVIAWSSSLWVMVLALLVPAAMGFCLLGPMMTATLTSRWFFRHRGLALGIAAVATSGGGFVVVPLLSRAVEHYGWRQALLAEAIVFFVIILGLASLVLKDNPFSAGFGEHPENKGQTDSALLHKGNAKNIEPQVWRWRQTLGSRAFWAPSLLIAMISGLCQALVVSAPAYGRQLGFTLAASAFLISAFSIAAALTKIAAGVMSDYSDKRVLIFASAVLLMAALMILSLSTGYGAILTALSIAGVALGGVLPASNALIAERFGASRFGSVIGWNYVLIYGSVILAVRFVGSSFGRTGSYHVAFQGLLLAMLLMSVVAFLIEMRPKSKS